MMFKNQYWAFGSALTPRFCDEVIKHAATKKLSIASTGQEGNDRNMVKQPLDKKEITNLKYSRDSEVTWLDDKWIYREIQPYITKANKLAGWNFDWDFSESMQFTKYKLNQKYDWHQDSWDEPYIDPKNVKCGKVRKLSVTCQLTDGSEYKGGELEFDFRDYNPNMRDESKHLVQAKEILPKGSIIVFPSYLWHRVKPVTKGVRYSLVVWNLGHPFK